VAAMDEWEVRATVNADAGNMNRRVKGFGKVSSTLETHDAVVLVSLTAEGVLTLRLARPGQPHGALMIQGRLVRDLTGVMSFRPSIPRLGFSVEVER
jgi:hypothetical protein